ncbi:MAG: DUF2812 domain-containing protein, partial [[Clostridium] cellulosi]
MAKRGFRLVKTSRLSYVFESCEPSKFEYRVEFAGEKSYKELNKYCDFLNSMGYKTFFKNLNLNYSIGKVKWRPWSGKFA